MSFSICTNNETGRESRQLRQFELLMPLPRPGATEKREQEGRALKARWVEYRQRNPGVNQEQIAEQFGITQGFFGHMINGRRPIPLELLIDLAIEMNFDPREIRPEIDDFMGKLLRSIEGRNHALLEKRLKSLSPERRESATKYLEFLLAEQSDD